MTLAVKMALNPYTTNQLKHVRKVKGGFGKIYVSTGVRKLGNTYASPTALV